MYYVTSNDNVKIAVYDYNPQGKETILLVHGWPLSHKIYEYQIPLLLCHDYRVIAIDLRGFGNSDTPACGYSYNQMTTDIYQVVRYLRLNCFTLVGFSMGGAIVLRYMNLFKGYGVKKLILLAAAAPSWIKREDYPYGLTKEYVDSLIYQISMDRAQFSYQFSHNQLFFTPKSNAIKSWFEDISLSASAVATLETAKSLRDEDGRSDLETVRVPTVIIHGARDSVVPNDLAHIQHKGIKDSKLVMLPNSGHGIMYDDLLNFNQVFLKALEN